LTAMRVSAHSTGNCPEKQQQLAPQPGSSQTCTDTPSPSACPRTSRGPSVTPYRALPGVARGSEHRHESQRPQYRELSRETAATSAATRIVSNKAGGEPIRRPPRLVRAPQGARASLLIARFQASPEALNRLTLGRMSGWEESQKGKYREQLYQL
jgi:hypothetical protein